MFLQPGTNRFQVGGIGAKGAYLLALAIGRGHTHHDFLGADVGPRHLGLDGTHLDKGSFPIHSLLLWLSSFTHW